MDGAALKCAFEEDGVVSGIRVRTAGEAEAIRASWNELEAAEDMRRNGYSTVHSRHLDQRFVWDLASDPVILQHVAALMGPDILLFGTRFFCKYGPDTGYHVSWHQDLDSWGLLPPVALTVWYAIDRSDEENGCVQVIPGSHRDGLREHDTQQPEGGNLLGRGQRLGLAETEQRKARPIILEAGEMSIHHGALVHASLANRSARRRCGLAIRYVPTYVRQIADLAKSPPAQAILVHGVDRERHFGVHPRPFS
jgi:non-heme Fe2+,alpha-ketoglutarate-dependent halogenase